MSAPRRLMAAATSALTAMPSAPPRTRLLSEADTEPLAGLMLDAYRGTIDDEGATLEEAFAEVRRTFDGGYGPMIWEASFVTLSAEHPGLFDSAAIITLFRDEPLLAFSMTRPAAKRRGLAGALICASARALAALGHARVQLVVTAGNAAAERLYEKLGFEDVSIA